MIYKYKIILLLFQLETNEAILLFKARQALNKYGNYLVISNVLHNRKKKVFLVSQDSEVEISLSNDKHEIEKIIVEKVIQNYKNFLQTQPR